MVARSDPGQRSARLTLPTGCDHHNLIARQAINLIHVDGFGKVFQIPCGLRRLDNPVKRATGKTELAVRGFRYFTQCF